MKRVELKDIRSLAQIMKDTGLTGLELVEEGKKSVWKNVCLLRLFQRPRRLPEPVRRVRLRFRRKNLKRIRA